LAILDAQFSASREPFFDGFAAFFDILRGEVSLACISVVFVVTPSTGFEKRFVALHGSALAVMTMAFAVMFVLFFGLVFGLVGSSAVNASAASAGMTCGGTVLAFMIFSVSGPVSLSRTTVGACAPSRFGRSLSKSAHEALSVMVTGPGPGLRHS
jgi:hypothetical protein